MNLPKSLPRRLHKRSMHFDDERSIGNCIIVSLAHGWKNNEDPMQVGHTICADTIREAVYGVASAVPCDCAECKAKH